MMIDEDACLVVASWQSSSWHLSLFWSFFPLWVDLHIGMLLELTSSTSCTKTLRGVATQKYALQFRFILRN